MSFARSFRQLMTAFGPSLLPLGAMTLVASGAGPGLGPGVAMGQEEASEVAPANPASDSASETNVGEENRPEIVAMIELLGAAEPDRREQAARDLVRKGNIALPTLLNLARHPSLEVRLRIIEVVSEIRQNDVAHRLAQLLSGEVDPVELELPSWTRWSESVGDSKETRSLYAEMAEKQWDLLAFAEDADETQVTQRVSSLLISFSQSGQVIDSPSYVACLFLSADLKSSDSNIAVNLSNFSRHEAIRLMISQGRYSTATKALLDRLIMNMNPAYSSIAFQLAIEFSLTNGRVLALKMIEKSTEIHESQLRPAVTTLARLGTKEDLPALESLFDDRRAVIVFLNNQQRESQLRDFALASAILLDDQRLDDYGIISPITQRSEWHFGVSVGFDTDAARDAAFEKWKIHRASTATEGE